MNKFNALIKIADIHVERIQESLTKLAEIYPLDQDVILSLSKENFLYIELLNGRFARLQDFIGNQVINIFLLSKLENVDQLTMIDKLNMLERLGVIENLDLWKEMREARNHVSHEYPDNPELSAAYINKIYELSPKLINILNNIKARMD